jgi:2'-5' RNA ligase
MKRVFVAALLSAALKKQIREWKAAHRLLVRWTAEENLHVTVVPPWPEEDIEEVAGRLERIRGRVTPFELRFSKVSYGPDPRRPRLIWATGEKSEGLEELQQKILRLLGREPERRALRPHVTLARLRPQDRSRLPQKFSESIDWTEKVKAVYLMESILRPEGAEYRVLREIDLE